MKFFYILFFIIKNINIFFQKLKIKTIESINLFI